MAQLTADQLGAYTVPAHLLWIYLFDWMTMAAVARGYCRKGSRFSICHRGIFLINWPFDTRPKRRPAGWLGYGTERGRGSRNFQLGATLALLPQSIIPSDQHPVVHIGSYEVWQQTIQIKLTNL